MNLRTSIILSLAFTIGIAFVFSTLATPKPKLPLDPKPLFNLYNEIYFNGQLPKDRIEIETGEIISSDGSEIMAVTYVTNPLPHHYKIVISPRYNVADVTEELSLLHELCHVQIWDMNFPDYTGGHNYLFQSCMKNLVDENAFEYVW